MKYYIDTCVWIDFVEGRTDDDFLARCIENEDIIIYSYPLEKELLGHIKNEKFRMIYGILLYKGLVETVHVHENQKHEANALSLSREIPFADALHAILARDNNAVLCTRDNHFRRLADICDILFL